MARDKKALVAKATALGVKDAESMGVRDLAKAIKAAGDKKVGGAAPAAAAKFKGAKAVSVVDSEGDHIRTYSEKDHGENFVDLAHQFASKQEGRKVVAAEVEAESEDEAE